MRKFLTYVILIPVVILLLAFALANREIVRISFDPFNSATPASSFSMPLFVLIFILLIIGVAIGGAAAWLGQTKYRRAARISNDEIRKLRQDIETLNLRLADTTRTPPADDVTKIGYSPPQP